MLRSLVTGGAGFIGSHLSQYLLKKGHFVRILDDFSTGTKKNISYLKQYPKRLYEVKEGDIRSSRICQKSCKGIDFVFHLAALKSVPRSLRTPKIFNDVNVNGTLCVLQAALQEKVRRFIFASSSSIYGNSRVFPQTETHLPAPISPYGVTKLAGEHYCGVFSNLYGLETVRLRYFNVFGPRQPYNDVYSAAIVKFIHCYLQGNPPKIFGTGRQSRDFTYIDNVLLANYLCALKPGLKNEVFNVATGKAHSLIDLVQELNEISGEQGRPLFLPFRPGDVYKSFPDITKIKRTVSFKPPVSFEQGLRKTYMYFFQGEGGRK
jgi:nucleoside-diphosphate-sugar epimerase